MPLTDDSMAQYLKLANVIVSNCYDDCDTNGRNSRHIFC